MKSLAQANILTFPQARTVETDTYDLNLREMVTGGQSHFKALRDPERDVVRIINTLTDETEWLICRVGGTQNAN